MKVGWETHLQLALKHAREKKHVTAGRAEKRDAYRRGYGMKHRE